MTQQPVARPQIGCSFWLLWVLASTVAVFVLVGVFVDVVGVVGVAVGMVLFGVSVGIAQWLVLRRQVSSAGLWVLASTVGGGVVGVVAVFVGVFGVVAVVGALVAGGAITSGALVWLLRQAAPEA
jgi:hypothetical protein